MKFALGPDYAWRLAASSSASAASYSACLPDGEVRGGELKVLWHQLACFYPLGLTENCVISYSFIFPIKIAIWACTPFSNPAMTLLKGRPQPLLHHFRGQRLCHFRLLSSEAPVETLGKMMWLMPEMGYTPKNLLVLSREWIGTGVAGMIITSDYGSFPKIPCVVFSTSKKMANAKRVIIMKTLDYV